MPSRTPPAGRRAPASRPLGPRRTPRSGRTDRDRRSPGTALRASRRLRQLLLRRLLLRIDERHLDDHGRDLALRALDLELRAELGVLDGHHGVADVPLQARREAGGGDLADASAALVDREDVDHRAVVVGAETLAADLDPRQLALGAL